MNTYWNSNGRHQTMLVALEKLIPDVGSVEHPKTNKKLEKLRKACNVYYDLYNNGLCNYKANFSKVFGVSSKKFNKGFGKYTEEMYKFVELQMDKIILEAFEEQKAIIVCNM